MTQTAGGWKSVNYSLTVVKQVGIGNSYSSAVSKNTCKVCAYGMGGQKGGMTNELGERLEICKKSIQAQLTDIQKEIPPELFQNTSLYELQEKSARDLERLGRLNHPLYKAKNGTHFTPITWDEALKKIISKFKLTPSHRTFFYTSGRSSNEAAFILHLFARLYGTNNVNNCSYYCHQASSVGISTTLGTSTATIQLQDIKQSDLVFVIGANPASNHPRFLTELMHCRRRGGKVVIINPAKEPGLVRFSVPSSFRSMASGGSDLASAYLQPHIGGDIALLKGIAKYILNHKKEDQSFINNYTNGYNAYKKDIEDTSWEVIEKNSGIAREEIEQVAAWYCGSSNTIFAWAMGITHHTHGVDNVECLVNLAMLRGMVGRENAGLLPLRGHSNVQGIGSMGVTPQLKEKVFENIQTKFGVKLPDTPGWDTMSCMQAAFDNQVDIAFILGGNLYGSNPDLAFAEKALSNIPFKIFLNTTLNQGHLFGMNGEAIILPVLVRDEEKQPTTQESMFNYVRLSDGGPMRLTNTRSEVDIITDIAIAVLEEKTVSFKKFKDHRTIRKAIGAIIPGFEKMETLDETKDEFHISGRTYHHPEFSTEDKKAIFKVIAMPPLPLVQSEDHFFTLMSVRSEGQFNTIVYDEEDAWRGQLERWVVLMNIVDIKKLGLTQDALVTLVSATGQMNGVKVRQFDIKPGNVMGYYPETNVLISRASDKRSLTPAFKNTRIKIKIFNQQ